MRFPYDRTGGFAGPEYSEVFEAIRAGIIKPHIGNKFSLSEIAAAHKAAEARATEGATIIIP